MTNQQINFPSEEIINPKVLTSKNYEHIILWMLFNNDACEWSHFTSEPINIPEATLSRYLSLLNKKAYVGKISRGHYQITDEGKKRYHKLSQPLRRAHKLSYPPEIILRTGRNYDHWIIWMVYNNKFCKRTAFTEEPLSINQHALSKNLKFLMEQGFVQKDEFGYKITHSGKSEYSKILRNYDLDRQTILEEESKRIDDISAKTAQFFNEYDISDGEVKFRFLNMVLKMDYSKVSMILTNEKDFHKILLYLAINHPDFYPNFISIEEFSKLYQIKQKVLDFWIDEIISGKIYDIKIHHLKVPPDKYYFFESDEKLEKILRAITVNRITKHKFLQKFGDLTSIEMVISDILDEACESLFNVELKDSLKVFLPEYIKHLAYKVESKKKLIGTLDKLESIIWQDLANLFHSTKPKTLESQFKEGIQEINRKIALNPMNYEYNNEKVRILVYFNHYSELLDFLDEMLEKFPEYEIELLMKKASILKIQRKLKAGLEIIEELIKKYPDNNDLLNYKAYWLQYLGNKEGALEIIQLLIQNNPESALYQDTLGEILMYFEEFENAAKIFLKVIILDPSSWFVYQTYIKLGSCYLALKKLDLAKKNFERGKELILENEKDAETKQNWLAIVELLLAELIEQKNEV